MLDRVLRADGLLMWNSLNAGGLRTLGQEPPMDRGVEAVVGSGSGLGVDVGAEEVSGADV
jgi:hypothetical protein